MHPGQGAPITLVNCFPPPGREGEDPSRLISMLTIKGKSFFFFLRGSYCVMIAFTYFTETKYTYADGLPKDLTFPPGRYINFSFLLQLLREPEATCSSFTRQNETHCLLFN